MINEYYKLLNILYRDINFKEDSKVYPVRVEAKASWYIDGKNLYFLLSKNESSENDEERILPHFVNDKNWVKYKIMKPSSFYKQVIYEGKKYTGILVTTKTKKNKFLMIFSNKKKQA